MKEKLIRMLKGNRTLFMFAYFIKYFRYICIYFPTHHFRYWLVKNKFISNRIYAHWEKYKNIHQGQRCFIVATGPSLTFEDLNLIKSEYSFGVNSIVQILDKTEWEPTYYGIQDRFVYEKLEQDILKSKFNTVFVSHSLKKAYKLGPSFLPFFNYTCKYVAPNNPVFSSGFSDNVAERVFNGYSVTYSMLQIAVYMGFKEIYLLGCDCSYSQDKTKQHFIESGHHDNYAFIAGKRMICAYKYAKEFADKHDIKIYNATRGGMLEVFERVNLEDLFSNSRK